MRQILKFNPWKMGALWFVQTVSGSVIMKLFFKAFLMKSV